MTKLCAALVALAALALPATAAANAKDRDHDKMPDKWEKKFGLNTKKNDSRKDKDHDGLRNVYEYQAGTNPTVADTNGDGIEDGDQAGTIDTFNTTTGVLTIKLFGGGTLSGLVDSGTEIECDDQNGSAPTGTAPTGNSSGNGSSDDRVVAAHNGGSDETDGQNNQQGVNQDDNEDDGGNCGPEALTQNRVVKEAEITGNGTQTLFKKVELAG